MIPGDALARVLEARSNLIISQPFYGTLALNLGPVETDRFPTMATDGKRLAFNPAFVATLSDMELQGVIAHEIGHCVYQHATRRNGRDRELYNRAGDYAINRDLVQAGFRLPKGALVDARFDGLNTDEIYSVLNMERQAEKPAGGQRQAKGDNASGDASNGASEPGAGSGDASEQGTCGDPGACGEVLDAAPEYDEAGNSQVESEWEARTRQAVAVAKAAGKLPGGIVSLISELDRPRIDPAEIFRRFVDKSASRDFSWRKPNRRYASRGLIMPGYVPLRPAHIVAVVDTSGSTMGARPAFAGFLQAMLDDGAADRLTVVYADTEVQRADEFEPGDQINLDSPGNGGTAFRQPLAWIGENIPAASAIAYLTDCYTSDWGDAPSAPVLWLVCGAPDAAKAAAAHAPFGETVILNQ